MPVLRVVLLLLTVVHGATAQADCVILLHGLARTSKSMAPLEQPLRAAGYRVENIDYPSRAAPIERLAPKAIAAGLRRCNLSAAEQVHFVTHSMGGILVRYYLATHNVDGMGRVVMLAPPNGGSEIVDRLKDVPGFGLINGPAGTQLGTGVEDLPSQLGKVTYPVGVIAGTRTANPILSQYLPNPDDGKVALERTKVSGMEDFVATAAAHPFIMRDPVVIAQTLAFLRTGAFEHDSP